MILALIALVSAAIFFGAAFYINFAEHLGRMAISSDAAVRQWAPAYSRGYMMQSSLAIVSGVCGVVMWWQGSGANWLAGGVLMLLNWPWTMLAIMPVNRRLLAIGAGQGAQDQATTAGLLARWNELHAVRSGLSLLAVVAFVYGLTAW